MIHYEDIIRVETDEEASQFRYEHNDKLVEAGSFVGYEKDVRPKYRPPENTRVPWTCINIDETEIELILFGGIYYTGNNISDDQ
tara:strand:- start:216 stop:467 length:252 start_codon:yes stop_codon:yes gene_type:complete